MSNFLKENSRRLHGTSLTEMPVALWVIFVGMGLPLLCLTLTVVRYGFFLEAARQAGDIAAQAQTYSTSTTGAVSLAQARAYIVASSFSGITLSPSDVKCYIVITPITSSFSASTVVGPNVPLSSPADTANNLYQLRVNVSGQIQPIVSISPYGGLSIPGLNAPFLVNTSMTRVFENPEGLSI